MTPDQSARASEELVEDVEVGRPLVVDAMCACVVCLEDCETRLDNPLLMRICGCTRSAIHRECLEKLVNSRVRRRLPLHERMRCAVCLHSYEMRFKASVLENEPSSPPLCSIRNAPPAFRTLIVLLAFAYFMAFGVESLGSVAGESAAYGLLIVIVLASVLCLITNSWRRTNGAADIYSDELIKRMDDDTFWTKVVQTQRGSKVNREVTLGEEVPEAQRHRVIVHIMSHGESPIEQSADTSVASHAEAVGTGVTSTLEQSEGIHRTMSSPVLSHHAAPRATADAAELPESPKSSPALSVRSLSSSAVHDSSARGRRRFDWIMPLPALTLPSTRHAQDVEDPCPA
mmetsp:Transcript_5588/g.14281  ORF Transcript_5588/g.14281 Transcript_5588/m.14281 type:complete len:344 (-) Transcript_5588:144-1175(-)